MTISGCDNSSLTTWECPLNELLIRGVHCIIVENDNNNHMWLLINMQCNVLRNPLLFNIASPTLIKQCPPWCIYLWLRHSTNAHWSYWLDSILPHVDHTLCIRQSETEQVQRSQFVQSVLTQAHLTMSYMARTHSIYSLTLRQSQLVYWEPCSSLSGNNNVGWGSLTCIVHVDTLTENDTDGSRYWCVDLLLVHITSCDH